MSLIISRYILYTLYIRYLIYNANHSFYKYYRDSIKFDNFSFKSKNYFLDKFFKDLNKFNKLKTQKEKT